MQVEKIIRKEEREDDNKDGKAERVNKKKLEEKKVKMKIKTGKLKVRKIKT
jgi:hypothetical protein